MPSRRLGISSPTFLFALRCRGFRGGKTAAAIAGHVMTSLPRRVMERTTAAAMVAHGEGRCAAMRRWPPILSELNPVRKVWM
nr:unnamed protein product [Digitaria exilis]